MNKLRAALAFGGILSPTDIEDIALLFPHRKLEPEQHFQGFNKQANEIAFVESGVMRSNGLKFDCKCIANFL
jgi:hypothetical protein